MVAAQRVAPGLRSFVDLIVGVGGLCVLAQKLVLPRQLLEACPLAIRHVLVDQPTRVRDLPLLVNIVVLHCHPQLVFIGLNQAANVRNVEHVRVSAITEVFGQCDLLLSAFGATSVDLEIAYRVCFLHLEGDHDRGDDFVGALWSLLHTAADNVNCVPGARLDLSCWVHSLLHQPARVESWRVRVHEVDRVLSKVVI